MNNTQSSISLCEDLTITVGQRTLVDGQSWSVNTGDITVLMGPSGVGKSVLASVLFGIEESPDINTIGTRKEAADFGTLVFQHDSAIGHLSIIENLRIAGASKLVAYRLADEFQLPHDAPAWTLSGGESRRLATAVALAADRQLIWLDEPAAGLDVIRTRKLADELMLRAKERNLAIIVATHDTEFAALIADRVVLMGNHGKLREIDSADDQSSPKNLEQTLLAHFSEEQDASLPERSSRKRFSLRDASANVGWPIEFAQAIAGLRGAFTGVPSTWWKTFARGLRLGVLEGAMFYPFVGAIFGGIFVFIFRLTLVFLDTAQIVQAFGPMIVMRFAPPFAAILAAARSGSAIGAWLGKMASEQQLIGLRLLGVPVAARLTSAVWLAMCLATIVAVMTFGGALLGVFVGYSTWMADVPSAQLLQPFISVDGVAALLKTCVYATVTASIVNHVAQSASKTPGTIATGITTAIVRATIWVMISELAILGFEWWTA